MDHIPVRAEAALGAGLISTPVWMTALNDISSVAGFVATICGAIVGIHAVYRIWKNRRRKPSKRADAEEREDLDIINR